MKAEVHRDRAQDIKDRAIILNFTSTEECFGAASLWLGYWLSPDLKLSSRRTSLPGVYVSFSSSCTRFLSWYHNGPVIRCCCYGIAHTQFAQEAVSGKCTSATSHTYPFRAVLTKPLTWKVAHWQSTCSEEIWLCQISLACSVILNTIQYWKRAKSESGNVFFRYWQCKALCWK